MHGRAPLRGPGATISSGARAEADRPPSSTSGRPRVRRETTPLHVPGGTPGPHAARHRRLAALPHAPACSLNLGVPSRPGRRGESRPASRWCRFPHAFRASCGPGRRAPYVLLEDVIPAELAALFPGRGSSRRPPSGSLATPRWSSTTKGASDYSRPSKTSSQATPEPVVRLEMRAARARRWSSGCGARRPSGGGRLPRRWAPRPQGPREPRGAAGAGGSAGPAIEALAPLDVNEQETSSPYSTRATCFCTTPTSPSTRSCRFVSRGRRRSRRARHQADALPDQRRLPDRPRAGAGRRRGKQVTVLVELDGPLRRAAEHPLGAAPRGSRGPRHLRHPRLKTHAKICLVVRREAAGIRRYVHLGTGNYNDSTARLYTDFGLMTATATSARTPRPSSTP